MEFTYTHNKYTFYQLNEYYVNIILFSSADSALCLAKWINKIGVFSYIRV